MPRPTHLTSLVNPRVKQVVRLRDHRHRRKTGLFIAEGIRELERAVIAGLRIRQLFRVEALLKLRPERLHALEALQLHDDSAIEHFTTTPAVFEKMAYLQHPEGVLAIVEQPSFSLDNLPAVKTNTRYVVAVGLEKPGNLGAIVRTAEAAGFDAVLAAGPVDPFNPNAIRTSTCAVFSLPVVGTDPRAIREHLTRHDIPLIAAALENAVPHTQTDWTAPFALAIGAEDTGLEPEWLDFASQRVYIPMRRRIVDSLNASNAAAVLMFESIRSAAS